MKNTLLKIANLLYINVQYINDYGLLNGKMGAVLFFYEYSRYANNPAYSHFADSILDDIIDAISNKKISNSLDFPEGLRGIGWGVQYLINHNFVEREADEVLLDFDKEIQEYINHLRTIFITDRRNKYIAKHEFLLGIDTYILSRSKNTIYNIDNLQQIADFYFYILKSGNTFSLQFLNSCYSFLLFNNKKMEGKHTLLLRDKLKESYQISIEEKQYVYSDIKVLQRLMEQKECLMNIDYPKTTTEQDLEMLTDIESYLKYFNSELLSFDSNYQALKEETVSEYLNELMKDMPSADLTLGKGLVGVGLSILKAI